MKKEDLNSVILFLIEQTSKKARQYSQREFDLLHMDITVEQWILLKVVQQHENKSQTEIASLSLRDPASITRTLDLLEKKGMISRTGVEGNRRQNNIALTKEGRFFILQNMPLIDHMRYKGLKGFTKSEIEEFRNYLLRMKENYSLK